MVTSGKSIGKYIHVFKYSVRKMCVDTRNRLDASDIILKIFSCTGNSVVKLLYGTLKWTLTVHL